MHTKDSGLDNSEQAPSHLQSLISSLTESKGVQGHIPSNKNVNEVRSDPNLSPKPLLQGFRGRTVPWQTMTAILKTNLLPVSRGWDQTIHTVHAYSKTDDDWADKYSALHEGYKEYLLTGAKALQLFQVEKQQMDKLIEFFLSYEPEKTVFHEKYPFPLDQKNLKNVDSDPHLVSIEDEDDYISLVFCSKRTITRQESVSFDSLKDAAKEDLGNFDKLVAFKKEMRQYFDVIAIPKGGDKIEVRIDISTNSGLLDEKQVVFYRVIHAFNCLANKVVGIDSVLKQPINLFPLVYRLYDSDEGRVCEVGFTTDEGSIKLEKMRKTLRQKDLRTETYHKAGKSAVHFISLYRLGIVWRFPLLHEVVTYPEVLLPGKFSILSAEQQRLNHLLITNCSGSRDYNFVLGNVLKYLGDTDERTSSH